MKDKAAEKLETLINKHRDAIKADTPNNAEAFKLCAWLLVSFGMAQVKHCGGPQVGELISQQVNLVLKDAVKSGAHIEMKH